MKGYESQIELFTFDLTGNGELFWIPYWVILLKQVVKKISSGVENELGRRESKDLH